MNNNGQDLPSNLNARQQAVGRHVGGRSLRRAIRLAAFAFFGFTHSNSSGEALWSDRQRVWLGKKTFLHWAMSDPDIDIPRTIATAANVPDTPEALRESFAGNWTVTGPTN